MEKNNKNQLKEYRFFKTEAKYCLENIYWVCSPDGDIVVPILVDMKNSSLINMLTFEKCPIKCQDYNENKLCTLCSTVLGRVYNKDNLFCMPSIEALGAYCFTKGHGIDPTFKLPRASDYELMQPKEYEKVVKSAFKNARFNFEQILKLKLYVESDIFDNYVTAKYLDENLTF